MNILLWIIFGALAGWLASMITKSSQSLIVDIIVGVVGAFIGGFVFNALGRSGVTGFNIYSLLVSVVGAIILLLIVKAFTRKA